MNIDQTSREVPIHCAAFAMSAAGTPVIAETWSGV